MLIVTGFEPFRNFKTNPSMKLVKWLEDELDFVKHVIVPVTFDEAREYAKEIVNSKPEGIIAFGLADGRPQISLEKVAVNVMDSTGPDNKGAIPKREKVFDDGEETYISTLPLYEILDALHREYIPAYISYTAGTYVCNTLFYSLLYYTDKMALKIPVGFIHLPATEDMVLKRKAPYVNFSTMQKAAKIIVNTTYRLSSP